jgi:hypothetical protein
VKPIGLSTTDNADITRGGDGVRPFICPARAWGFGNDSIHPYRDPGVNNWDLNFARNIPLGSETRRLQFRCEMYNAFNPTEFRAVDGTANFDAATNQVNGRFGQVTARALRAQSSLRYVCNSD